MSLIFNSNSIRLGNGSYSELKDKPAINGVELTSNTTLSDLGLDKVLNYCGQVDTEEDLKSKESTAKIGDVYNIKNTNENFAWNGSSWDSLDSDLVEQLKENLNQEIKNRESADTTINNNLNNHTGNTNNPHNVTKAQVGLSNVDNTSDLNKPISTATQSALDTKANATDVYTKSEIDTNFATKEEIPTKLPNPEALTVTVNKEAFVTYDGSAAVTQDLVMNAETIPLNADTTLTVAYGLEEVTPLVVQVPIRTLQDKVYDQKTILGWFSQESVADLKQKIVRNAPVFVKYGIQLSGNPHYYKFPVEYCAFESDNQIKMVFQGLNTKDDVVSKYEIIINLDGTVIEGNSNVKITITSLENKADKATTLAGYGIEDAYTKSEVDSKLDTKQNTLSTEQLDAVNSGITAEHITSYDAYAGEISAAQLTADKADKAAEVAQQTANLVGTNLQTVTEKIPTSASSSNLLVDTASMNESLLSKLSFKQITVPANNWYIYAEAPKDEVTTFYVDGANYFNAKIPEMIVIGLSSTKVSSVSTMAYDDSVTTLNSSYGSKQYYETDDKIRIAIKSSSEIQVNVYFDPNSNLTVLDTPVLPTSEDGSAKSVKSATLPSLSYLTNYFVKNDDYKTSLGSMYKISVGVFTNNEQMPSDNRTLVLSLGDGIYDDTGANSSTNYFSLLAIDKTTKKLYLFVGDETNLTRQSWKEITTLEELNAVQSEINTSLGNKADKATTLSGYGITDAYTSEEVDNKLSQELATKQDSLTTDQLNAVNSGITTEKVTEYDNYVAMIIKEW